MQIKQTLVKLWVMRRLFACALSLSFNRQEDLSCLCDLTHYNQHVHIIAIAKTDRKCKVS